VAHTIIAVGIRTDFDWTPLMIAQAAVGLHLLPVRIDTLRKKDCGVVEVGSLEIVLAAVCSG
tara:strand:- start:421 stop:606 length:186 start_codon:yes stop_codon:yes gene_type:complete